MHIDIRIPIKRGALTVFLLGIGMGLIISNWEHLSADATGTGGQTKAEVRIESEQSINRERLRQEVLKRRVEILTYQIQKLEEETKSDNGASTAALSESRKILLAIIKEQRASEELLKNSLAQLWESQGVAFGKASRNVSYELVWPVEPLLGISAHFADDAYQRRFGIPHHAIDIPTNQGTIIRAPADGVVTVAADNGLGYSYLTIKHDGNIETVYGHVSGFIVDVGDDVQTGDPIAYSGGRPGSPGAGLLTTGPHLHFAVRDNSKLVDPLDYLEKWNGLQEFEDAHE